MATVDVKRRKEKKKKERAKQRSSSKQKKEEKWGEKNVGKPGVGFSHRGRLQKKRS